MGVYTIPYMYAPWLPFWRIEFILSLYIRNYFVLNSLNYNQSILIINILGLHSWASILLCTIPYGRAGEFNLYLHFLIYLCAVPLCRINQFFTWVATSRMINHSLDRMNNAFDWVDLWGGRNYPTGALAVCTIPTLDKVKIQKRIWMNYPIIEFILIYMFVYLSYKYTWVCG